MERFEGHMRKYHPNSVVARLSRENEELRGIVARIDRVTYGSEAYPISDADQRRMTELVKGWGG